MTRFAPAKKPVYFTCNDDGGCANELHTNELDLSEAQDILRARGWACYPVEGGYRHACPECYVAFITDRCQRVVPYDNDKYHGVTIGLEAYARKEGRKTITWTADVYAAVEQHNARMRKPARRYYRSEIPLPRYRERDYHGY